MIAFTVARSAFPNRLHVSKTRSSAVAKRPLDGSYWSVVSFNIPTAQFFYYYYCGFRFTSA